MTEVKKIILIPPSSIGSPTKEPNPSRPQTETQTDAPAQTDQHVAAQPRPETSQGDTPSRIRKFFNKLPQGPLGFGAVILAGAAIGAGAKLIDTSPSHVTSPARTINLGSHESKLKPETVDTPSELRKLNSNCDPHPYQIVWVNERFSAEAITCRIKNPTTDIYEKINAVVIVQNSQSGEPTDTSVAKGYLAAPEDNRSYFTSLPIEDPDTGNTSEIVFKVSPQSHIFDAWELNGPAA